MVQKEWTFEEIMRETQVGKLYPVYLLMGEEPYYIDRLAQTIADCALKEEERDFNQTILYGTDSDVGTVINTAKRYPMMSDYQLVILREAQQMKKIDDLSFYLEKPLESTILIIEHKGASVDKRKRLAGLAAKVGVVFESKRLYDSKIPAFVTAYLNQRKFRIDAKAAQMLVDFLGNDLTKIAGELDKLVISAGEGAREITPELIESNIGISKEYNNFEFIDALVAGNVLKAQRIAMYFASNQKMYPLVMTVSALFNYFRLH